MCCMHKFATTDNHDHGLQTKQPAEIMTVITHAPDMICAQYAHGLAACACDMYIMYM